METRFRRFLSLVLVACMLVGSMGVSALALDETETNEQTVPETEVVSETPDAAVEEEAPAAAEEAAEPEASDADTVVLEGTMVNPTRANANTNTSTEYQYSIVHVDNGRKYFSVSSLKQIIDNAAAAGFNNVELAVGNDGLRFLLDDMSLTVNGVDYTSAEVSAAIHAGNEAYSNFTVDELTQADMDEIITYATSKGVGIIPCINTPGHMDAILSAAESLTGKTLSYSRSARTIDVTNKTAVAFTQALLQKYITYFANQGCKVFNMGADEYANDVYTTGGMGFANLQSTGKYRYFVDYVNQVAAMIKAAGMTPMAFNDGIYYNGNTSSGTFDTDILISHWSNGWSRTTGGYIPAEPSFLQSKGFKLINTNGDYYWVLGKSDWQCNATKASGFDYKEFNGGTIIENPVGAMFCIWCDYPKAGTEQSVVNATADTITAFGQTLPEVNQGTTTDPDPEPTPDPEPKNETVTDETTGITVTANGVNLTSISVSSVAEPSIEGAVAYDITLNGGDYTGKATVSLPIPANWDTNNIRGYVAASAHGEAQNDITGTAENGFFTFVAPHFSEVGMTLLGAGEEPNVTSVETVTVAVGASTTRTQDGHQTVVGNGPDATIATAVTEYTHQDTETAFEQVSSITSGNGYIIKSGDYYMVREGNTLTAKTDPAQATVWKITYGHSSNGNSVGYYLSNGGYYVSSNGTYGVELSQQYAIFFQYSGNGLYASNRYIGYDVSNGWTRYSGNSNAVGTLVTTEAVDQTTITFTGVTVGTTYVTVGDTRYTVVVKDQAPSNALTGSSLKVEYWISNSNVHEDANASAANSATVYRNNASTDKGVAITSVAAATGYSNYDGWQEVKFWQGMRLDSANHQTGDPGDDETTDGTSFTHVRYHNNAWQYKTADGVWHYFLSGDQAVAYYLKHTKITKEVTTAVKDWGYETSKTTPDTSSGKGQVALSVAVVYPDGTVSPAEGNIYSSSTTIFNYWSGRDIGIVAPINNEDYNISKITVTDGNRTNNKSANVWYTNDTITWSKKTQDDGVTQWYNEKTVWDKDSGTEPMVSGKTSNITWSAKNTAKLILIYLEPVKKDTNLTVKWVDDSKSGYQIHEMDVVVSGDGTETFLNSLNNNGWAVKAGEITLDDAAYVTNSSGVNQTFNKNLTELQNIPAQYKSGAYKYTKADISEDGKVLTLHYEIDSSKLEGSYVVDFGLPMTFPLSDFVQNPESVSNVEVLGDKDTLTYDASTKNFTYTPASVLQTTDTVSFRVTYNASNSAVFIAGMIPATTVYYEEGFATYGTGWSVTGTGSWTSTGSKGTKAQETHKANVGGKNNYGYDGVYDTASTTTAASATAEKDTVQFSFTGTGVDLFANCDENSGKVMIRVQDSTGTTKKMLLVDMADKGAYATGGTAYNTPIASISGLTYGQYTVTAYLAVPGDSGFKFDGFRVYDTMDEKNHADISAIYNADDEDNPSYLELRNVVLKAVAKTDDDKEALKKAVQQVYDGSVDEKIKGVVTYEGYGTDSNAVQTLLNEGPKNELYLKPGMSVTFKIATNRKVEIGMRSVKGDEVKYSINSDNGTMNSAVDMFYTLKGKTNSATETTYTIKNTGSAGILSITDIKVCDEVAENIFVDLTVDDVVNALTKPVAPAYTADSFSDVSKDDWCYDAIDFVARRDIMHGMTDGTFAPNMELTRAFLVVALHRLDGSVTPTKSAGFSDVEDGKWYSDAINWAAEIGIVNGYGDGTFGPNSTLTREQMVAILARYAKYKGTDVPADAVIPQQYTDRGNVHSFATSAFAWSIEQNLVKGTTATTLAPQASATRAQMAVILMRFIQAGFAG